MRKTCGNALTQYGIIILLIAIALIPIFFVFGNTIYSSFKSYYDTFKDSNNTNTVNTSNLKGGSLGGSPEQPIKKCSNGSCMIDFGEFVLDGIPEDFSEVVRANGISGGSDKLINLIQQLAKHLEEQGKDQQALELKKLASLGHNIALIENQVETAMNKCNGDFTCAKYAMNIGLPKPDGYDESFFSYPTNYDSVINAIAIGQQRNDLIYYPNDYNTSLSSNSPSALFVKQFDTILQSNCSDNIKKVVQELYSEIGKLSEDAKSGVDYVVYGSYEKEYKDPLTGKINDNVDLPEDPFSIYSNYKPSSMTHVDSALICATGNYDDTGKKCD